MKNTHPIRLGVSACLAGEHVRYDGRDKLDTYVTETLAHHFEIVPVCPEVGIGLGVPRPPIRLEGLPSRPRAVVIESNKELTRSLQAFGRRTARELRGVSGLILKSRSPSCGLESVAVHGARGGAKPGGGIFARELTNALPLLPVVEEQSLAQAEERDHFLERVFAYRRWQAFASRRVTPARLMEFHAQHKLILMAHSPKHYRSLGRLAAQMRNEEIGSTLSEYGRLFMQALAIRATPPKQANVLQHLMGYLKRLLDADDKRELSDAIDDYRKAENSLLVPFTLLRHHFRRHPNPYVAGQLYLYPERDELKVRFR